MAHRVVAQQAFVDEALALRVNQQVAVEAELESEVLVVLVLLGRAGRLGVGSAVLARAVAEGLLHGSAGGEAHVDAVAGAQGGAARGRVELVGLQVLLLHLAVAQVAAGGDDDRLGVDGDDGAVVALGHEARGLAVLHDQLGGSGLVQDLDAVVNKGLFPELYALLDRGEDEVEAFLLALERGLEAEVRVLELVADALHHGDGVLGGLQALAHERRVGRPVDVLHHVVEDFVNRQGGADLAAQQHVGADGERAGNLDAVDGSDGRALLHDDDLRACLGSGDGSHEAGSAAADHGDVAVIGLVRAGDLGDLLGEERSGIAAGLRNAVRHGVDDGLRGLGRARDDVQTASLILDDGRDQLILHHGEQDRGLAVLYDLDRGDRGLGEGGLHGDVGDVAVAGGGVGAGLVGSAFGQNAHRSNGQTEAGGAHALEEAAAGNVLAHKILLLFIRQHTAAFDDIITYVWPGKQLHIAISVRIGQNCA